MTAKHQQLRIGIGINYLLSELHDIWWKTELLLIFLKVHPVGLQSGVFISCPQLCTVYRYRLIAVRIT